MIRKALFSLLAICLFSFVSNAEDITGKWKGMVETPDGSFEVIFDFTVDGTSVTGTFDSGMSLEQIQDGKFKEDNEKVFTFNAYVDAAQQNIDFKGTVKEDEKITIEVVGFDMFIELKKVKEEKY